MCSDALRTRSRKTPTRRIACDLEHLLSQSAGKVCYLRRVLSQRCACSGACYLRAVLCQSCALSEVCFLRRVLPQSCALSEVCFLRAGLSQPSGAQCRQARHVIARHGSAGTRPTYLLSPGGTTHFIFT